MTSYRRSVWQGQFKVRVWPPLLLDQLDWSVWVNMPGENEHVVCIKGLAGGLCVCVCVCVWDTWCMYAVWNGALCRCVSIYIFFCCFHPRSHRITGPASRLRMMRRSKRSKFREGDCSRSHAATRGFPPPAPRISQAPRGFVERHILFVSTQRTADPKTCTSAHSSSSTLNWELLWGRPRLLTDCQSPAAEAKLETAATGINSTSFRFAANLSDLFSFKPMDLLSFTMKKS